MITTNTIARSQGSMLEQQRTSYAITAHIADLQDRIRNSHNDEVKRAWTVAIIELQQLQRTLEKRNK